MKKIVSALLVCFILVGSMFALVSCGGGIKNGTYKSEDGMTVKINGDNLTLVEEEDGMTMEIKYTYEIKDDKITFTWGDAEAEENATVVENGPFDFEKGKDYIKIGGLTLTKDQ